MNQPTDKPADIPAPDNAPDAAPDPGETLAMANAGNTARASWRISLHDIRVNLAHCRHDAKEAMVSCFLWCIDPRHPVTANEFAAAVEYDVTTIYRIYAGKYLNPATRERLDVPPKLVGAAKAWLSRQRKAFEPIGDFILTPTARRCWRACEFALESHTPVFLLGRSHLGKTWALEKFAADNNHGRTVYTRILAASGLGGLVRLINNRCGNSDKGNTADTIERIKRALTPDTLLILDEVHLLQYTYRQSSFFACLEVIRDIYDHVKCGMVLCGTDLLMDKMRGGTHGEMEQLIRRGVHRFVLPTMPTRGDVEAFLDHYGLPMPPKSAVSRVDVGGVIVAEKPYDLLRQLARDYGAKAICERLRYADKLASKAKVPMSLDHFVMADAMIKSNACADASDWD